MWQLQLRSCLLQYSSDSSLHASGVVRMMRTRVTETWVSGEVLSSQLTTSCMVPADVLIEIKTAILSAPQFSWMLDNLHRKAQRPARSCRAGHDWPLRQVITTSGRGVQGACSRQGLPELRRTCTVHSGKGEGLTFRSDETRFLALPGCRRWKGTTREIIAIPV